MQVVDPGHEYLLDALDGEQENRLVFVKREGPNYPGNLGHHAGTTMQEVLRALVDRAVYVNSQIPSAHTQAAIYYMKSAIFEFENRAAKRHGRAAPDIENAVYGEKCKKCGHIGCHGECHP